jgi:hypothetical protein
MLIRYNSKCDDIGVVYILFINEFKKSVLNKHGQAPIFVWYTEIYLILGKAAQGQS